MYFASQRKHTLNTLTLQTGKSHSRDTDNLRHNHNKLRCAQQVLYTHRRLLQCCCTSTETVRTIRDVQVYCHTALSSDAMFQCCFTSTEITASQLLTSDTQALPIHAFNQMSSCTSQTDENRCKATDRRSKPAFEQSWALRFHSQNTLDNSHNRTMVSQSVTQDGN